MRLRYLTGTLAALAGAAPALADGTATWLWDVTTQDGDAIVEPGETATVTLSLLMEPFPGEAESEAISAAIFDTLGDAGAYKGQILDWQILNDLDNLTGDLTTTDGSSLYNTNAGQLTVFTGPFTSDNPVDVLQFEWMPVESGAFEVGYLTDSYTEGAHTVRVWEFNDDDAESVVYPVSEAMIEFSVVPGPGGVVVAGALLGWRRRRG